MNKSVSTLVALLISGSASAVSAKEAWLLVARNYRHDLVLATDTGFKTIQSLGDLTVYANSNSKLAVVSYDKAARKGSLLVIDKETRGIEATWPVDAYPVSLLTGPSEEMVLAPDAVFFASVRYASDGMSINRNSLGGTFDLVRVSLVDGSVTTTPIPGEVNYPRLALVNGAVTVRTTTNSKLWTLDASRRELQETSGAREAAATRVVESVSDVGSADGTRAHPGSVVALASGKKVFVNSATGSIQTISRDGKPKVLWNVATEAPGASLSETRVIAMTDNSAE